VYLLDYVWEESLGNAVRANLPKMADLASRSNAVVINGPRGVHFEDEVLSWHRVNGQDAKDILPAILVTTRHPSTFRESFEMKRSKKETSDALLLIPLRRAWKSAEDVVELIQRVFEEIKDKMQLSKFRAAKRMRRGVAGTLVDATYCSRKSVARLHQQGPLKHLSCFQEAGPPATHTPLIPTKSLVLLATLLARFADYHGKIEVAPYRLCT
jgi:hypothetical protein